ncbi:MAG TPA: endonuclease III [Ignavibacteriaceae bacterium]|nr:endonuclease III [Ignavibacteriaceae bacterium]
MLKKSKTVSKRISKVNELLIQKYGIPFRPQNPPDPVDMLIATILSQNTNDKNSYKAFTNLKKTYQNWYDVSTLPLAKIEKEIKIAGLGKQKSKAIKNVLRSLLKNNGRISLDHLLNKKDGEILKELTGYEGVGVKTASCVLLFSLRKNICPVDTHVHRTTNRIGIVSTKTPDKTFLILNENLPEGVAHSFHTNLIRLGREICKPANPNCFICPLVRICNYPQKNFEAKNSYKENTFLLLDNV